MTIALFNKLANWLEQNSRPCFYKENFGFDCFGCGIQRSFIELLRGNVWESIKQYPALIPLIILFIALISHLKFRFNHGTKIILIFFFLSVVLIMGNFLFKLTLK